MPFWCTFFFTPITFNQQPTFSRIAMDYISCCLYFRPVGLYQFDIPLKVQQQRWCYVSNVYYFWTPSWHATPPRLKSDFWVDNQAEMTRAPKKSKWCGGCRMWLNAESKWEIQVRVQNTASDRQRHTWYVNWTFVILLCCKFTPGILSKFSSVLHTGVYYCNKQHRQIITRLLSPQ